MANYNPDDAVQCLPEGDYQAVLMKAEEKLSKKQNEMIVLTWEVYGPGGKKHFVNDYIVLPDGTWKIKRLAQALHKLKQFEDRAFQPVDEKGCSVTLTLKVEEQDGFDDKNTVKAYKPFPCETVGRKVDVPKKEPAKKKEPVALTDGFVPDENYSDIPF